VIDESPIKPAKPMVYFLKQDLLRHLARQTKRK
jgi:hypothetical protein